MINSRIHNPKVDTGIRSSYPNTRVSNFQTTRSGESAITQTLGVGSPIGLLLVLTYAEEIVTTQTLGFFGDYRPNVRIN